MNECVLVADDDTNITDVCRRYLEREGYLVVTAKDGLEAIEPVAQPNAKLDCARPDDAT